MNQLSMIEGNAQPPAPTREEMLVELAKRGEASAFVELTDRHYGPIFRKTYQITGNREDAEDALQSAQMKAFMHIGSFDGRSLFSTWMTRIAINSALGILRKKRALREVPFEAKLDDDNGLTCIQIPDTRFCPEALYADYERGAQMQQAVGRLRPNLRRVIELRQSQHLSTVEIAERLSISVSAAKSRLSRARNILRRSMP
ncbi:RNA polymerase sigma factor [Acidisarcina polymorpha]|nr:sigma-70 family RNA polymerase sigma factor [Acidisarcina polymorpha]